ncbi:MAG TPA: GAF domain-containing protein [Gaiellaceae bacterium]|nr:GAF domain-containing protein [Gaiellaceae bacterium]
MSDDTRAILQEAAPLLGLAGVYALAGLALLVAIVRERRPSRLGAALLLLFALLAACAGVLGGLRAAGSEPLGDASPWLVLAGAALAAIPGLVVLLAGAERALLVSGPARLRDAEELVVDRSREVEAISQLSAALSRAQTARETVEALFDQVEDVLRPDSLLLARVDQSARRAEGFAARGVDEDWWRGVVLDLDQDPGAVVTVARSREPVAVYDVPSSPSVNRTLAEAVHAKSAAFLPLVSEGEVVGVLVVASTGEHRHYSGSELGLVQELAAEAALALGRSRSNEALTAALERERLVAEIGRRVRSELDLDTVLRVAIEETGKALRLSRGFVRLGDEGEAMSILAQWNAPGVPSVGEAAPRMPVLNLAARERRTIAVDDVETATEIDDPTLGARDNLVIGTRAVLATPIMVFDRMIGVLGLHRPQATHWEPGEIAFAEAVSRELGLAIHTARLLGENEQRLRRQETLIEAAQVLTSDLHFESVIRRLVQEVVSFTGADAADCWILEPDRTLLRCRAVVGVPEWNVGRQIPPEGTIGTALRTGQTVLTHEFAATEQPPPSPPYAVFNDVMCAPITWQGEPRGVLGVCARAASKFDTADVEMLEAFARFASLALHNAESFEERERQAQVQRGFYRIAQALGSPLSRQETLEALAQAAGEALGGDSVLVLELSGGQLVLAAAHEAAETVRERFAAGVPETVGRFAWAARELRILSSGELAGDERFDPELRSLLTREGYGSLICAPVAGGRDQTYVVVVLNRAARSFTDEDVLLARHLSDAARGALERSELFEAERRARTFSQRLARVGGVLATSLDPGLVLEEVAREAPALLGADAAVIRLLAGDTLRVSTAYGRGAEQLAGTTSSATSGISGIVAQSRVPLSVRDVREQPRLARGDPLLEDETAACVAVPMFAHGGGLYGVLAVYSHEARAWRDDEIQSLSALAAAASASVANAELYQRVAEEKERSSAILANIADGIVATDRDGAIVLWNAMAEQITGVPAAEALGRRVPEVLQRDLAADEDEPHGERQVAIPRGASEVWLAVTEAVMLDPAGVVAGRIFAFRDVSSERVVEQMKSDFVSTVSHELRTPLTSIYGFAETLMRDDVSFGEAERTTFLRYIASESERVIRIVDDLLNVARLEAGTLDVSLGPADVGEVARQALGGVHLHPEAEHHIEVEVEPGEVVVRADREKLVQVLANLLDNAVRYSPEGGMVTVSARRRTYTAEITVADEGLGIDRADRHRIFTKFFRADRGDPGMQGTGLGLFLVRGLVTVMGGRIWVEEGRPAGSRFTFELPLAGAEPAEAPKAEAAVRT